MHTGENFFVFPDALIPRLHKIMELMSVMETYSVLANCRIEAVDNEGIWKVVQLLFNNLKKKPYDPPRSSQDGL